MFSPLKHESVQHLIHGPSPAKPLLYCSRALSTIAEDALGGCVYWPCGKLCSVAVFITILEFKNNGIRVIVWRVEGILIAGTHRM